MEQAFATGQKLSMPFVKSVALIKFVDYKTFTFNLKYFMDTLTEYIYPDKQKAECFNDHIMDAYSSSNWQTKTYTGVDVYDYLAKFPLDELNLGKNMIDYRLYHAMLDHKVYMIRRLEFLVRKGVIDERKRSLIESYVQIKRNVESVRNSILKYNSKTNDSIISYISTKLTETKLLEIDILKQIFEIK
jgi:hypothetical protein